jgi:hypothetical protein
MLFEVVIWLRMPSSDWEDSLGAITCAINGEGAEWYVNESETPRGRDRDANERITLVPGKIVHICRSQGN